MPQAPIPRGEHASRRARQDVAVRRLSGLVAALLAVLTVAGCAPGTPDEDSWRDDATRAVGDVASAVQTARLALVQSLEENLPDPYLQTVMVDRLVRRIHRHSGYVPMSDVGPVDWEEQTVEIRGPLQPLDHP
jgi:hypothetical protein